MSEVRWMKEFGAKLREILEYTWTSQEELADYICVSQSTISRYITGQQMPSVWTVIQIAKALDWNVDDLIDFGEDIY